MTRNGYYKPLQHVGCVKCIELNGITNGQILAKDAWIYHNKIFCVQHKPEQATRLPLDRDATIIPPE